MRLKLGFIILFVSALGLADEKCKDELANGGLAAWRSHETHSEETKALAATSLVREQKMQNYKKEMEAYILNDKDTPEMEFLVAEGVGVKVLKSWQNGEIPHIEVTGLGASGKLRGTLLLPVSGHTGVENARKWSTTDTYQLFYKHSSSTDEVVSHAKSLDLITMHELELTLEKGTVTCLTYHRSGSGGPGGYPGGRTLYLSWDGN